MTLDQLRVFVQVAERQHLTQAASALALTPSAVSSSIRALEEQCGIALFNRVGRGIELNEAGRIFLLEARSTLASARRAEQTLAELGGLQRGSLSLQASQTIASYWLPPLLVRFRQAYPQIELDLTIGNTQSVAQAVLDGAADLGFVEGSVDAPALRIDAIGEDRMLVVVAPDHPWAGRRRLRAEDLAAGQWIMREPGSGTRSGFESALRAIGVDVSALHIALTLPSNEAVRSAVMAGRYATVVSELVAGADIGAGRLRAAPIELAPRAFYKLRHGARHRSRAALALEQMMGERAPAFIS